jgi:hypothetical protein
MMKAPGWTALRQGTMTWPGRGRARQAVSVFDINDVEAGARHHEDAIAGAELLPLGPFRRLARSVNVEHGLAADAAV